MLSNHTIEHLEERIVYSKKHLAANPNLKNIFQKDLDKFEAMLTEAQARDIIGFDVKDNARVYLNEGVVWVESKSSGWIAENFNISVGMTASVCYDGETKWFGEIKFSENR